MPERVYDLHDLVRAQVEARRWEGAAASLAAHHTSRYQAMARAFGTSNGDSVAVDERIARGLLVQIDGAVASMSALHSPFAGWIESPAYLLPIYERFSPPINHGLRATEAAIEELLVYLTSEVWGISPDATITDEELRAAGFDPSMPAPDEFDFL